MLSRPRASLCVPLCLKPETPLSWFGKCIPGGKSRLTFILMARTHGLFCREWRITFRATALLVPSGRVRSPWQAPAKCTGREIQVPSRLCSFRLWHQPMPVSYWQSASAQSCLRMAGQRIACRAVQALWPRADAGAWPPDEKKAETQSVRPFLNSGAGNETFTRRVSRCFPNTFFAEVASEDLDYSLVFRLRQQDRPKSSTGVHRPALCTPDPHSSQRRQRRSRTGPPAPLLSVPAPLPR